mmetsp:Transcript_16711/g.38417  ORF Transcript_16711/g.38417 Transcript_16711/m.38417 type:complete len:85 (+) Transcript_16711:1359-1613(+)
MAEEEKEERKEVAKEASDKEKEGDGLEASDIDKETEKKQVKRAWLLSTEDRGYFFIGAIGACLAGLVFPAWGVIKSMTLLLFLV